MPIINKSNEETLKLKLVAANSRLAQVAGLLGTSRAAVNFAYLIKNCQGIHTFGMQYPIDVIFLDGDNRVLDITRNLKPNRSSKVCKGAKSLLEVPSGQLRTGLILVGDRLELQIDEYLGLNWRGLSNLLHWPANIFMGFLWTNFALTSFNHFVQTGGPFSIGILFINTLLLGLFFTRRHSKEISRRVWDWIIPIATVMFSMLLAPADDPGAVSQNSISLTLQGVGIVAMAFSLLNLGRSFGVIPANRKVKQAGVYSVVRHPLYASELIFYLGFLLGNLTTWNAVLVVAILAGQIYRCISEEALLSKEKTYLNYKQRVKFRLVPGVF